MLLIDSSCSRYPGSSRGDIADKSNVSKRALHEDRAEPVALVLGECSSSHVIALDIA